MKTWQNMVLIIINEIPTTGKHYFECATETLYFSCAMTPTFQEEKFEFITGWKIKMHWSLTTATVLIANKVISVGHVT